MENFYKLIFICLYAFVSFESYASCHFSDSTSYVSVPFNAGNIIAQRDTPVGSTLAQIIVGKWSGASVQCNYENTYFNEMSIFDVKSSMGGEVYNTNITGVGVEIFDDYRGKFVPFTIKDPGGYNYIYDSYQINFIKTGKIQSGPLETGKVIIAGISDTETPRLEAFDVSLTGGTVTEVACSIKTPSLTFPIGDVQATKFGTSVGTIPDGGENTQNLGLDCDAGANINVSLNGTQNPDLSDDSILALTGQGDAGVASGVGVQLLYNDAPLKLNNRIVLKKSDGGQESFPIKARYYQTKTAVTTGTANATATLELTYQ